MAIILKQNQVYINPQDKEESLNYVYGVIDYLNTEKSLKKATIRIDIYKRLCTKEERKDKVIVPLIQDFVQAENEVYDQYFSPEAIAASGDQYETAYTYILTLENYQNFKSDEGIDTL